MALYVSRSLIAHGPKKKIRINKKRVKTDLDAYIILYIIIICVCGVRRLGDYDPMMIGIEDDATTASPLRV